MKATTFLKQQHRNVETIFTKLEAAGSDRASLLEQLANELVDHMVIEQDIFYPAVRAHYEQIVGESLEEHAIAEVALKRLLRAGPEDSTFEFKLAALKEIVENHIDEEEETLFPSVEKALGEKALETLGAALKKAFTKAHRESFVALIPRGFAKTSADVHKGAFSVSNIGRVSAHR